MNTVKTMDHQEEKFNNTLDFIRSYVELYPNDTVVIKGDAAAYIHLSKYGNEVYIDFIDINIKSEETDETVMGRFSLLGSNYKTTTKNLSRSSSMFTHNCETGMEFPINVFVDGDCEQDYSNGLSVVTIDSLLKYYRYYLTTRAILENLKYGSYGYTNEVIEEMRSKYARTNKRLIQFEVLEKVRIVNMYNIKGCEN